MGCNVLVGYCCTERDKEPKSRDDMDSSDPQFQGRNSAASFRGKGNLGIRADSKRTGLQGARLDHGMMLQASDSKKSITKQEYEYLLNETMRSGRSVAGTPHGNTFLEFQSEPLLISKHEKKLEWTKLGIINYFDTLCHIKTFRHSLKSDLCNFWINDKGTPFMKFFPLIQTQYLFPKRFTMEQVINAIHDPTRRVKWDPNINEIKNVRKVNRIQLVQMNYASHVLDSTQRDSFEKKFGFTYRPPVQDPDMDNKLSETDKNSNLNATFQSGVSRPKYLSDQIEYFMFASSIDKPQIIEECPLAKDNIRTHTYLTLQKFEMVKVSEQNGNEEQQEKDIEEQSIKTDFFNQPSTQKSDQINLPSFKETKEESTKQQEKTKARMSNEYQVKMTGFLQCDPKLSKLKNGLYKAYLPQSTQDFYDNLTNYLKENN